MTSRVTIIRNAITLSTLIAGLCATSGCVSPQGGLTGPQAPAGQTNITPALSQHQTPQSAPVSPKIATVGHLGGFGHRETTSACGPNQACNPGQACGCGCGTPVAPHGYAPVTYPTNAYGVDPQEFLCDGGDRFGDAHVRRDDSIGGLQAEDTVVHYTTEAGDIEVNASNQVCVYAPRFKSVRKVTGALAGGHAVGLAGVNRPVGPSNIEYNEGGVVIGESIELAHADVSRSIDALRDRNRGVPVDAVQQPEQATDFLAVLVGLTFEQLAQLNEDQKAALEELTLAAVAWTLDESVEVEISDVKAPSLTRDQSVEGFTVYDFPDAGRLKIVKLADRSDAQPGEMVNFAIRVENAGDSPVNQVVITDNLTTRLEYVEDSQTCTAGANFETVRNESASLQLLWKLTDELKVGESATIRFRCRVR